MAGSEIDKVVEELIEKYDVKLLMEAARQLIQQESGKEELSCTREQIAEFVSKLDLDRLMTMKSIADEISLKERLSTR